MHDIMKTTYDIREAPATGNGDIDGYIAQCNACSHYFTSSFKSGMDRDMITHI